MASVTKRDYYDVLGIGRETSDDEIKKAFRRLARQYHPDLQTDPQQKKKAEEKFKEANEAYEVLSNPELRKRYDVFGHSGGTQGFGGAEGFDIGRGFGDIFGDVFEDFFGGGRGGRTRQEQGHDLQYNMELSFEEAIDGKEAKLKIPRWEGCDACHGTGAKSANAVKPCPACQGMGQIRLQQGFFTINRTCGQCQGAGQIIADPCPTCRGQKRVYRERTLSVTIPPGIESGMRLRLAREGEHGLNGGSPGDLYVAITIKPHSVFARNGNDILVEQSIDIVTATLGGKIEVPTIKGKSILKIPEGTQHDRVLRLQGLGAPALKGRGKGDQLVRIKIHVPTKLSAKQRQLLAAFAKEGETLTDEQKDGLFDKVKNMFD